MLTIVSVLHHVVPSVLLVAVVAFIPFALNELATFQQQTAETKNGLLILLWNGASALSVAAAIGLFLGVMLWAIRVMAEQNRLYLLESARQRRLYRQRLGSTPGKVSSESDSPSELGPLQNWHQPPRSFSQRLSQFVAGGQSAESQEGRAAKVPFRSPMPFWLSPIVAMRAVFQTAKPTGDIGDSEASRSDHDKEFRLEKITPPRSAEFFRAILERIKQLVGRK